MSKIHEVAIVTSLVAILSVPAIAQQAQTKPAHGSMTMQEQMPESCKAMMEKHQAMQTRMKEMDARLEEMVVAMRAATGAAKVERMESVIAEMVSQRMKMREQMQKMMPMMMHHMGEHMGAGMKMGSEAMEKCPMMKMHGKAAEGESHQHQD